MTRVRSEGWSVGRASPGDSGVRSAVWAFSEVWEIHGTYSPQEGVILLQGGTSL